ncbi:uncharacterized protein LOC116851790 [Odontomachus brunneus]|uniref:uncharacterized protein LOC116851790 n=1 Tax=Odontomachus brunneus TaxID=486640 RepID=UPI0013F281CB|nr:uncharacterized protein LOC116851790 [Odontomachus brunneus]
MGNANSTRPPKTQKDRKTEGHGSADTGKGRRSVSGNGRAAAGSSTRNFGKRDRVGARATNPFIIFFLQLRSKKPKEPVTVVARAAGKLWGRMSSEQRKKYVDLANEEKKRRQEHRRRRKHSNARSRMK